MRHLLFITSLLLLVSCSSRKEDNTLEDENLNGNVKTIIEYEFYPVVRDGELLQSEYSSNTVYNYNKQGNLTNRKVYNEDSTNTFRDQFIYNKQDKLIEHLQFEQDEEITFRRTYKYNKRNYLVRERNYYGYGDLWREEISFYNEQDQLKKTIVYGMGDTVGSRTTYEYNDEDLLLCSKHFGKDDQNNPSMETYEYYENQEIRKVSYYDRTGQLKSTTYYTYDEYGNIIEKGHFHGDTILSKLYNYEYSELDKNNNWLKKKSFVDHYLRRIYEREIEYY